MSEKRMRLTVYSLSHFLVDFCCAMLIFRIVPGFSAAALLYLLYNYCAFALQMPIGLIADKLGHNALLAAAGCALVGLSFAFFSLPLLAAAVAGLGNACFHVGGGLDVLNDSPGRAAPLGIYVSPGAAGLFFGTQLGKGTTPLLLGALLMLFSLAFILLTAHKTHALSASRNAPLSFRGLSSPSFLLPSLCLFCVVILRSFSGMILSYDWKAIGLWGFASTLAVVLGKCAGGFAMDRLGARKTVLLSLLPAAVLFCFAQFPPAGLAAIFLFNMTMPVTLSLLAQSMPGCKGFSFGLLTFALFLGFVPVALGFSPAPSGPLTFSLCLLSALLMLPSVLLRPIFPHRR